MQSCYFDKMTSLYHYLATAFQQVLQRCTQSTPGRARNLIFFFFFSPSVSPACAELISQRWVCPSRLNSVRDRPSLPYFSVAVKYEAGLNALSRRDLPPRTFSRRAHWSALANREPSGPLVALEHRDPPACRECLEKEEALAFLDPRETESVLTDDCLTSTTLRPASCHLIGFSTFSIVAGWHWRERTWGRPR